MKTIILNRPKSIEKYYDETKYKIFINGEMVTKLKRGEPEIDIARNHRFPYNNSPYIYLVVFLTALFPLLRFTGGWSTLLIVILVAAYVVYVIKYDIINRHN